MITTIQGQDLTAARKVEGLTKAPTSTITTTTESRPTFSSSSTRKLIHQSPFPKTDETTTTTTTTTAWPQQPRNDHGTRNVYEILPEGRMTFDSRFLFTGRSNSQSQGEEEAGSSLSLEEQRGQFRLDSWAFFGQRAWGKFIYPT